MGLDLSYRNLRGHDFRGQSLPGVDLRGADLRHSIWEGADIEGARMEGARIEWCEKVLLAEIVRQAAVAQGDLSRLEAADTLRNHPRWTWDDAYAHDWPHFDWCLTVLSQWYQEGDRIPDDRLRDRARSRRNAPDNIA